MKIVKSSMRVWLTFASVISFLMGWVLLSHAQKPAPLQVNQPAITAPSSVPQQSIQTFNFNSGSATFPFSSQSQSQFFRPSLRTGGS